MLGIPFKQKQPVGWFMGGHSMSHSLLRAPKTKQTGVGDSLKKHQHGLCRFFHVSLPSEPKTSQDAARRARGFLAASQSGGPGPQHRRAVAEIQREGPIRERRRQRGGGGEGGGSTGATWVLCSPNGMSKATLGETFKRNRAPWMMNRNTDPEECPTGFLVAHLVSSVPR